MHERQHYRLVSWRRADNEINYRRFFAINTLVGLRVEDPEVFEGTHREVLRWYREGGVDGIRIDHPDGLRDPAGYLRRLRAAAPDAWLVVEKILEHGEEPPDWPVAGTTGYEALRQVCGLFVDAAGEPAFTALDADLNGGRTDWVELAHGAKLTVATVLLRAELLRLVRLAGNTAAGPDAARPADGADAGGDAAVGEAAADAAVEEAAAADAAGGEAAGAVEAALAEVLSCFGVYR